MSDQLICLLGLFLYFGGPLYSFLWFSASAESLIKRRLKLKNTLFWQPPRGSFFFLPLSTKNKILNLRSSGRLEPGPRCKILITVSARQDKTGLARLCCATSRSPTNLESIKPPLVLLLHALERLSWEIKELRVCFYSITYPPPPPPSGCRENNKPSAAARPRAGLRKSGAGDWWRRHKSCCRRVGGWVHFGGLSYIGIVNKWLAAGLCKGSTRSFIYIKATFDFFTFGFRCK